MSGDGYICVAEFCVSIALRCAKRWFLSAEDSSIMHEDEPCGCIRFMRSERGQWNHGLIAIQIIRTQQLARYSKFNSVRLFAKLPARQL